MTIEEAKANLIHAIRWNDMPKKESLEVAVKALEQQPCEDVISRQAVLDAIDVKAWEFCDYLISKNRNDEQKPVSHFADTLRECVSEELPSVEPQPKTGHWIKKEDDTCWWYVCSECEQEPLKNRWNDDDVLSTFCPSCGARMT